MEFEEGHLALEFRRSKSSFSPAQYRCTRAKLPPQYCSTLRRSIFAEWGLEQANTRRGVFRVPDLTVRSASRATMSHAQKQAQRPKSRETGMKIATKRAASEAFAQMLAVTAMLVIASVVFYWR